MLKVAESAGFSGLDLLNLPAFKDAVANVDPTDRAAISRAIAINVAAHPELTRAPETWLDPRPGIKPFVDPPEDPNIERIAQTHQQRMAEKMRAKSEQSLGRGPVEFQQGA